MTVNGRTKPCFLIVAHADPIQFQRLLAHLSPHADVYIHIDAKANIEEFRPSPCPPNIHFIKPRSKVNWAAYSNVKVEIRLMDAALASGRDYSHMVLLSGACYPIKPMSEIIEHFSSRPDHSFIRFDDLRSGTGNRMLAFCELNFADIVPPRRSGLIARRISERLTRFLIRIGVRLPWPKSLIPAFGSQWWALTPECATDILKIARTNFLYRWRFKFIWCPDEIYFHTLVANSPHREKSDGLQFIDPATVTDHEKVSKLANVHLLDPMLMKVFNMDDWEDIVASKYLFVRKVSSKESAELLDRIDRELLSVEPSNSISTQQEAGSRT